jgi:hypothetical protein
LGNLVHRRDSILQFAVLSVREKKEPRSAVSGPQSDPEISS